MEGWDIAYFARVYNCYYYDLDVSTIHIIVVIFKLGKSFACNVLCIAYLCVSICCSNAVPTCDGTSK